MATKRRFVKARRVLEQRQVDLTVLLEKVHKAHNFNAIVRTCDAAGVFEAHAVLLEEGPRLRDLTSQGTAKWVQVRIHDDLEAAAGELKQRAFRLVVAHPGAGAVDFRSFDFTQPTALLFGTELHGVSRKALELADDRVRIPMGGMGPSLNVGVAAALLLFEARRQRESAGLYDRRQLDESTFRRLLFEWTHPQVAAHCRTVGQPYPDLDSEGEIVAG